MKRLKYLSIVLSGFLLLACNQKASKERKYVLMKEMGSHDRSSTYFDSVLFEAGSDSDAYCYGYQKFKISQKIHIETLTKFENADFLAIPKSFKILNYKRENICNSLSPLIKLAIETEINPQIDKVSISNNINKIEKVPLNIVKDSIRINELKKFFKIKKDEFDEDGLTWYTPKDAPYYRNRNGIYCYFGIKNNQTQNLRFVIQYASDDWLFVKNYKFSIDGKAYSFYPENQETDNGDGGIWEWCDESISTSDLPLIEAISNAKSAKIKFNGRQYFEDKSISQSQIKSIKRTLELFKLMGGVVR